MTVKELKEYLNQFDDETPISIQPKNDLDFRLSIDDWNFDSSSGELFIDLTFS